MMTIDRLNRLYARRCIRRCDGDLEAAAKILGISRATLYRWFPKGEECVVNKAQQTAKKKLNDAEVEFLVSYGWELKDGRWRHPRLPESELTQDGAVVATRINPRLGWP